MKEQLQDKLEKALDILLDGANFLEDELPLYMQELLLWLGIYEGIMCLIGFGMLFFTPKLVKIIKGIVPEGHGNWYRDMCGNVGLWGVYYIVFSAIGVLLYVIVALGRINLTWLQIIVAPRVWLVEYMSKMVGP